MFSRSSEYAIQALLARSTVRETARRAEDGYDSSNSHALPVEDPSQAGRAKASALIQKRAGRR